SFIGFVDDPGAFLDSLDVCCVPSRADALPYSLLEAMARGLPVVAFDVGGIGEALGEAGLLVDAGDVDGLADALAELLSSLGQRRRFGAAARQRAVTRYSAQ